MGLRLAGHMQAGNRQAEATHPGRQRQRTQAARGPGRSTCRNTCIHVYMYVYMYVHVDMSPGRSTRIHVYMYVHVYMGPGRSTCRHAHRGIVMVYSLSQYARVGTARLMQEHMYTYIYQYARLGTARLITESPHPVGI